MCALPPQLHLQNTWLDVSEHNQCPITSLTGQYATQTEAQKAIMKNKKAIMKNNRDTSGHTVRKKDFTDLIQASSKHRGKKKKNKGKK